MEEWRDIVGFEGLYQASTLANIKNAVTGKILKQKIDKRGRPQVCLFKDKKRYYMQVVTIMARTFIPNPENKPKALHIDGNKLNNLPENITWATNKEIVDHTWSRFDRNVVVFEGKRFNTESAVARHYGINPQTFSSRKQQGWTLEERLKIKVGVLKTAKVYLYEYLGKRYTLQQLADMKGIKKNTLQKRLENGWGFYEAVEVPLMRKYE